MKLFVKLMLALLVLAVLAPFTILKDNQGKPLMSFSKLNLQGFEMPDMPNLSSGSKVNPVAGSGGVDVFYKWYDASGTVQFTTEPPASGIEYTVKEFDPDTNLIEAVSLPEEEVVSETPQAGGDNKAAVKIGNPYNPEDIKKLLEDAQNIEKKLQQRFEDQNSAIN